jgi:hypothetical protein
MQRFLCSVVISIISSTLLVPQVGLSADDGLCFLRTESGRIIGLDALCLQRSQEKPMQKLNRDEFIQALKEKFPGFYTFDDLSPGLKERAVRQNGVATIRFAPGETATLPNGDRVEADGSLVKQNGMRLQPVIQDGKFLRQRVFKPDGTELNPGEKYTAPDGMSFVMPN